MDVILSFVSASIGALSPCACDPLWVRENLEPLLPERFPHSVVPADELLACLPSQASLCALSHQVAAVVYGVVYVLAVLQLVRFWLMPHKSGTQNVLHWLLVATALTRAVREAVLAVGLDHPLLVPLYFVPSLLMFSNMTVLAMLWVNLYNVATGKGKRDLADRPFVVIIHNFAVYMMTGAALYFNTRLGLLPAALGSILLGLSFIYGPMKKYQNLKDLNCGLINQFKWITLALLGATLMMVISSIVTISLTAHSLWDNSLRAFLIRETVMRSVELVQLVLLFVSAISATSLTVSPLPLKLKQLTPEWLTNVLQEDGVIDHHTSVRSFEAVSLRGGCHYKVSKLSLTYSDTCHTAPHTVVVKLLCWQKPFLERLSLYLRWKTGFSTDRETMYLESYSIEAAFYRNVAPLVKGLVLPAVYHNHADCFNNQFGMVMQNINFANLDDGQPGGFGANNAFLILQKLGRFHGTFWDHPLLPKMHLWPTAGHWTGEKRWEQKCRIKEEWRRTMENFHDSLVFTKESRKIGSRLQRNLDKLIAQFVAIPHKTLVHGDFKVTNVFVDKAKDAAESEVYVIDWQWAGQGTGAIDAAYFLCTSCSIDLLTLRNVKHMVKKAYHSTLLRFATNADYKFKLFWQQFMLCWVDFFVYCVTSKWSTMTPKTVQEYAEKSKDGLHLRSLPHMQAMIDLTYVFLNELDAA